MFEWVDFTKYKIEWNKSDVKARHKTQTFFSYQVWMKLLTLLCRDWTARITSGGNLTSSLKSNMHAAWLHTATLEKTPVLEHQGECFKMSQTTYIMQTTTELMLSWGGVCMVCRGVRVRGCIYLCWFACGGQKTPSGIIPRELFILFQKQALLGLELTKQAILADKWASASLCLTREDLNVDTTLPCVLLCGS